MEIELSLEFLRVVEQAAIESAKTMGRGDGHMADQAAVAAMRRVMDEVPMDGTIVIGEGERDAAPMLFIGKKSAPRSTSADLTFPPWTSRSIRSKARTCAPRERPARSPCSPRAKRADCFTRPICTWKKSLWDRPARALWTWMRPSPTIWARSPSVSIATSKDLVVIVLDRPRHEKLVADIRAAGARIRLIGDGDLSAGISAAVIGIGVHVVMGIGGAPEGVLTAAALRCLNGEILARLVVSKPEHEERLAKMGIKDGKRIYRTEDLAPGKKIIFACTGVTDGNLLRGVRFFGEGIRTQSLVVTLDERQVFASSTRSPWTSALHRKKVRFA